MADSCADEAFVSLATNDFYATGALVLGKSIRDVGTSRKLALLVTAGVSMEMKEALLKVWDELVEVEEMDSGDAESLAVLSRPELGVTFTKLAVWTLTQYTKCVYLDADTLVLQSVDELFSREELSAAPDIGWPDCFNSGVFVFCPSLVTFKRLVEFASQMGSFDGGDQGLLNLFWDKWTSEDIKYHLPFTYNMTANSSYGYAPAFLRFKDNIKIIHFIGPVKPWQHRYLSNLDTVILLPGTYGSQHSNQDFIQRWWQVYSSLTSLPPVDEDIQSTQTSHDPPFPSTHQPPPLQSSHTSSSSSSSSSYPISTSTSHRTSGAATNWPHGSIGSHHWGSGGGGDISSGSSSSDTDIEPAVLSSHIVVEAAHPGSGTFSHRREFEAGHVDYRGRDSFSNIFAHMKLSMGEEDQQGKAGDDSLKSVSASSLRSRGSSYCSRGSSDDREDLTKSQSEKEEEKKSALQSAVSASPASQSKVQSDSSSAVKSTVTPKSPALKKK